MALRTWELTDKWLGAGLLGRDGEQLKLPEKGMAAGGELRSSMAVWAVLSAVRRADVVNKFPAMGAEDYE